MPTTVLLHVLSYVGPQEVKNLALTATGFGRAAIIMTNMNQIRELQTFIDALIQTLSHTAGETHSLRLEILEGLIKRLTSIRNHVSPNCKDLKSLKTNDVFHIKDQLIDVLKELTPKELKAIAKISPPNFYPHFWKEARAAKYEELYCQETGRMVGDILKALASVEEFDVAIGFIEGLGEFGRYVFEQMSDKEVACTLRDISSRSLQD